MKKLLSIMLVLALLISTLAACVQDGDGDADAGESSTVEIIDSSSLETEGDKTPETEESKAPVESSTPETEESKNPDESSAPETEESSEPEETDPEVPASNDILISSLSDYYIIRTDVSDTVALSNKLNAAITDKFLVSTMGIKTDLVVEGNDDYSIRELEIIIGETNREESIDFAATLKSGEYGYKVVGKKIVILGKPASNTALALDKFISDVIDSHNDESDVFAFENTEFVHKIQYKFDTLTLNGSDIREFVIVYKNTHGANEEKLANEIKNTIARLTGIELKLVGSKKVTDENVKQIVVYDSKSLTSAMKSEKETLLNSLDDMNSDGVTIVDENIIWLYGYNIIGVKSAVDKFVGVVNATADGNITVSTDSNKAVTAPIKVMSFNVFVGTKIDTTDDIIDGGPAQRRIGVISTIRNHMPDVVGVQEASNLWISYLSNGLKDDYAYVGTGREPDRKDQNYNEGCQIFYNKSKYRVVETNTYWLSETPNEYSIYEGSNYPRIVTYAIFERISDGYQFMHVNTHLDFEDGVQKKQIDKMMELIEAVGFDGLTVYTGDFNLNSSRPGYALMNEYGCVNSYDLAQVSTEGSAAGIIDFCFVQSEGTGVVSEHYVVRDKFNGLYPSDHRAVWTVIVPSVDN